MLAGGIIIDRIIGELSGCRLENTVETVKVSPKYQVAIPKGVRNALGLRPGQEVAVIRYRNRIELVPMRPVSEMRGMLRRISSEVGRESDREL